MAVTWFNVPFNVGMLGIAGAVSTRVQIETNVPEGDVVYPTANFVYGSGAILDFEGGVGILRLPTRIGANPATFEYKVTLEVTRKGGKRQELGPYYLNAPAVDEASHPLAEWPGISSAPASWMTEATATLTAAGQSALQSTLTARDQTITVKDQAAAARDAAIAAKVYVEDLIITDLATTDGQTAALLNTPTSESALAADAKIAAGVDARIEVEPTATGPNTIVKGHASNAIAPDVERSIILGGGTTGYNSVIGGDGANVNTTTPNTTTTGTGAHVSVVGGYDNSAGALSSKIISDHAKTLPGSQGHNGIYGGAGGVATENAGFSFLTGKNPVADGLSVVVGGSDNTASGDASVAFGASNLAGGDFSQVSGSTNTASGTYSRVHGSNSTASGVYSSADGRYAVARRYGQHAHASGRVATDGDVQTSFHTVFGVTDDNTPQTLGVEGGNTYNSNHQMLRGQTVLVEAKVVGRSADGAIHAGFVLTGMAHFPDTGNASMLGGIEKRTIYNPEGLDATLIAALSVGQLAVRVTGHPTASITWSAKVDLVEVLS